MQKIDNEQFGQFLVQLRKEKDLTQKQLAEMLYISDKAVSKWERGLSLPDISLVIPLAKILGVTATELLSGKRMESDTQFTVEEVESLMTQTITFSEEEMAQQNQSKKHRQLFFLSSIFVVALEVLLLLSLGYTPVLLFENLITVEALMMIFGFYFAFILKESLPAYYDQNKIGFYQDCGFHINMPGVYFNNSNWKPIIDATSKTLAGISVLFPLLYWGISYMFPSLWQKGFLFFSLASAFSMFVPIYVVGKKYQ